MPPLRSSRRHYVFGLSVRPSVRPYVPFSWSRYLKNQWMDSCQTLVMYVSCSADELIRFWGHEVKGQRSQGSFMYAKTARDRVIWRTDWWIPAKLRSCMYLAETMNWLDFGVTRSKVKRHRAHYAAETARDRVISRTDWWIPAKLRSCMLLAEPMNWLNFGVMRSRSKVMQLIMHAKIACDRIIIRTDWWIPPKLRSCMYLAEPMNWVDSWVMRSKVKGHGLIMYAKIACERILIRTDRWITI